MFKKILGTMILFAVVASLIPLGVTQAYGATNPMSLYVKTTTVQRTANQTKKDTKKQTVQIKNLPSNYIVEWKSDNTSIATVKKSSQSKATVTVYLGKAGKAKITAVVRNEKTNSKVKTFTKTITVTTKKENLKPTPSSAFKYTIRAGKAEITAYTGSSGDIVLPDTIEGNPVVLCPGAFRDLKNLKSVTFINENPASYVPYDPGQAFSAAVPDRIIPATSYTETYIVGVEMYVDYYVYIAGVLTPIYNHRYIYGTRTVIVPEQIVPGSPAKPFIPVTPALGYSGNAFDGCSSDLKIYVPQNALSDYKNLFKGRSILSSTKNDSTDTVSISVKKPPSKTNYKFGDTLKTSGLTLEVKSRSGGTKTVTSGFTCSQKALKTIGRQSVIVTYGGKTAWFEINVDDKVKSISIKTMPDKTEYIAEESLDLLGLTLAVDYESGNKGTITDGYGSSLTILNMVGTQNVTIYYGGKTASFNVEVKDKVVGLSVAKRPNKNVYYEKEQLDTSGLTLTATYYSGKTETVTSGFICSPTELTTGGTQPINISYEGHSATFNVDVTWLKILDVVLLSHKSPSTVTVYTFSRYGAPFVEMTVEVFYNNGTSQIKKYYEYGSIYGIGTKGTTYIETYEVSYVENLASGEYYSKSFEFEITVIIGYD